ncbi:MAG: aminodeoxychorismate/anthranilate synthase component II [candidate division KSB1 bacterium]|nr:aminodeoxychorismate/anthranilate synthase component II [candidate division KSB1 bacterium]
MILVIDNYDSFTYNLVQYLGELDVELSVWRNDRISLAEIEYLKPQAIVISPGPGRPEEAGISVSLIQQFAGRYPILGICLGHQAIGQAFGGKIIPAPTLVHGKTSMIIHDRRGIFTGVTNPFVATRYHSLMVDRQSLPDCLEISAETDDGLIMGLRHKHYLVDGFQFHPESILTLEGKKLLKNFLEQTSA